MSFLMKRKAKVAKNKKEPIATGDESDAEIDEKTEAETPGNPEEDEKASKAAFMRTVKKIENKTKNCVSCNISIPEKASRCYSCHMDQPVDHLNVAHPVVMDKDTRLFKRYKITIVDEEDDDLIFHRYVYKLKDKNLINMLSSWVTISRVPTSRRKKHRAWVNARDIVVAMPQIRAYINAGNATQTFVQFIEGVERIHKDMVREIQNMVRKEKIVFDGLWYLFETGASIVSFHEHELLGSIIKSAHYQKGFMGGSFSITSASIKTNGEAFFYFDHQVSVVEFDGIKKTDELSVRLLSEDTYTELSRRGERFREIALGHHYQQYRGAMVRQGAYCSTKVKADGRIMVDVVTYNRMGKGGSTSYQYASQYNQYGTGQTDPNLIENLDDSELFMTWPFLPGFSFQTKDWGEFYVRRISEIVFDKEAFRSLVLPSDKKALIQALVEDHRVQMAELRKQTAEQEAKDRMEAKTGAVSSDLVDPRRAGKKGFTDLIAGKGGGCIFLLHGTPGVGKTLTAEAVSEYLQIPLYVVSVGELGTTPQALESGLKSILELASVWGCAILLDEADIFLEKRCKMDIVRNAMVGVFLHLLEYHQGVLFLTTNRLECLDDAFSSRISVALHYNELDRAARAQVWSNFLTAAADSTGDAPVFDIELLSAHRLNGRQIRSCVQISQALARRDEEDMQMKHLLTTIGVSLNFRRQFQKLGEVNKMNAIGEDGEDEETFLNMFQNCVMPDDVE